MNMTFIGEYGPLDEKDFGSFAYNESHHLFNIEVNHAVRDSIIQAHSFSSSIYD